MKDHTMTSETKPHHRSLRALDWLNICMSDVQTGVGPYLAIYLMATCHWDPARIELAMLAMLHARQELSFGRSITFELIGDEHPGHILAPFERLAEELLSRRFVPAPLHQNI
jgi:hypothetical protein